MDASDIYAFIDSMPHNTFLRFAKEKLRLTDRDIEEIEGRRPNALREQRYYMVKEWEVTMGRAATFKLLQDLFEEFRTYSRAPQSNNRVQNHIRTAETAPSGDQDSMNQSRLSDSSSGIYDQRSGIPAPQPNMASNATRTASSKFESPPGSDEVDGTASNAGEPAQSQHRPKLFDQSTVEPERLEEQDQAPNHGLIQNNDGTQREGVASSVEAQNKATVDDDDGAPRCSYQQQSDLLAEKIGSLDDYVALCSYKGQYAVVDNCPTEKASALNKNGEYYPILDKPIKGYVMILNNTFEDGSNNYSARKGSEVDVKRLKKLWDGIGSCEVIETHNLKGREMLAEIHKFVTSTIRKPCGFVAFFIMSHGNCDVYMTNGKKRKGEGYVVGNDGSKVMISQILRKLDNSYPGTTLQGTPKLIFFQTCRGNALHHGIDTSFNVVTDDAAVNQTQVVSDGNMPETGDVLQGYATQHGFKALRDEYKGSWYINAIVNIFSKYAKDEHILDLLTRVNCAVSGMSAHLKDTEEPCMEISEVTHTLRLKLHLFPTAKY